MRRLEDALIEVFASITGLDPNKGEIRVAYAENPGPSWKHTEDVLTFYLAPISDTYDQDQEETLTPGGEIFGRTTRHTQVIEANLSIYGPESRLIADRLRVLIQKEDLRRPLTSIKAFPVLKTPPARYVPYEYNKQWWQRTDMTLTFNWQTDVVDSVNRIMSANIIFKTEKGETRHADITTNTGS